MKVASTCLAAIHALIDRGDAKSLDYLLSPEKGMGWQWASTFAEGNLSREALLERAVSVDAYKLANMLGEGIRFALFYRLTRLLDRCRGNEFHFGVQTVETLLELGGMTASTLAKPFVRFFVESSGHSGFHWNLERIADGLAKRGCRRGLSWLLEADPSLLRSKTDCYDATINKDEFIQPELYVRRENPTHEFSLVEAAAHGDRVLNLYIGDKDKVEWYTRTLLQVCRQQPSFASLLRMLEKRRASIKSDHVREALLDYKLLLLNDDEGLNEQLEVLDYLVHEKGCDPPSALSAVRWRRCGVLRWLVSSCSLDLNAKAASVSEFVSKGMSLGIVGGRRIPPELSVAGFLCLAAVEYDDLYSLVWLLDEQKVPMASARCNGWNLSHACAFFGRSEIALCLQRRADWMTLVQEPSHREPFKSMHAVHIAVSKGFVFVADLLLDAGSPPEDVIGKGLDYHSKRSKLSFVHEWGKEKVKPQALFSDTKKLVDLVRAEPFCVERVQKHVSDTRCLEVRRWRESRYEDATVKGSDGLSYQQVVLECCENGGPDFVKWLCRELTPSFMSDQWRQFLDFWLAPLCENHEPIHRETLLQNDPIVGEWLKLPWIDDEGDVILGGDAKNPLIDWIERHFGCDYRFKGTLRGLRVEFLRCAFLADLHGQADSEIRRRLARGESAGSVDEMMRLLEQVTRLLSSMEGREYTSYFLTNDSVMDAHGCINMERHIISGTRDLGADVHPLDKFLPLRHKARMHRSTIWVTLPMEGYCELIHYCRTRSSSWSASLELRMTRVGAYFGHEEVVHYFLQEDTSFLSTVDERYQAAVLGAAEAGRVRRLSEYFEGVGKRRSIQASEAPVFLWPADGVMSAGKDETNDLRGWFPKSLLPVCMYGFLRASPSDSIDDYLGSIRLIVSTMGLSEDAVFASLTELANAVCDIFELERFAHLIRSLSVELSMDLQKQGDCIQGLFLSLFDDPWSVGQQEDNKDVAKRTSADWLDLLMLCGCDLRRLKLRYCVDEGSPMQKALRTAKAKQLKSWSQFDPVKRGVSLEELRQLCSTGAVALERQGLGGALCSHIAAAYDRPDILAWLVDDMGMSLDAQDGHGRNVLQSAELSGAVVATTWIKEKIAKQTLGRFFFVRVRLVAARRKRARQLRSIVSVQALYRAYGVRRATLPLITRHLEGWQRFQSIWRLVLNKIASDERASSVRTSAWEQIKTSRLDFVQDATDSSDDAVPRSVTAQMLEGATLAALDRNDDSPDDTKSGLIDAPEPRDDGADDYRGEQSPSSNEPVAVEGDLIRYTKEVAKWLRLGDSKYRAFFVRRMQQLKAGDRSRILAKRLVGCATPIYETYLEQKSGYRILWTQDGTDGILVWYVARHKEVSRLARLIDDASSRSQRQLVSVADLPELRPRFSGEDKDAEEGSRILLDPTGNTPLKLYELRFDEMQEIESNSWKPRLHLTDEERDIVETNGTVLVLGRSGTGKTVSICNRMERDRQLHPDASPRQLFVARSLPLRDSVESLVGPSESCTFTTFDRLVQMVEQSLRLRQPADAEKLFLPSQRMNFRIFKRDVYRSKEAGGLGALIIWTNIRTFFKGSIEAFQQPSGVLPREEYMKLGRRRCRLSPDQREAVGKTFDRYMRHMAENRLWDDCDRITSLLRRVESARRHDQAFFDYIHYDKVYADEVQDYIQIEIMLFFYLGGPGDLFLAGDPAQSVVEGVEFRFEDIRSVGFYLASSDRRCMIPDKPKTVNVNFRSHSGILNTAAAILRCLFGAFPDSAAQLRPDRGLFHGPRPGFFNKVDVDRLKELIQRLEGVVILTHDENVSYWRRALGNYPLVYGIREAKGLEFSAVVVLDFFRDLPNELQRPWRDMLLGRDSAAYVVTYPEIEGHLKLLYTGVTRCINRLFFAETTGSVAGSAFSRWLTIPGSSCEASFGLSEALGSRCSVDNVETMTMTPDEWCCRALDNAILAESAEDAALAVSLLERALYCFRQIEDEELSRKARAQLTSARMRARVEADEFSTVTAEEVEVLAAKTMDCLLSEALHAEALDLGECIVPILSEYSQEQLKEILVKLSPKQVRD